MDEKRFNEPRLALNRIYTRRGDMGQTSLAGGQRVGKDAVRLECFGTVDELNSFIGMACVTAGELASTCPEMTRLAAILRRVQHELFNLGSLLATLPEDLHPKQARVTAAEVERLESEIDDMNAQLPDLRSFVLPGGSRINTELHAGRTICRRAERLLTALSRQESVDPAALQYLNRLSDALFVWARWVNYQLGVEEVLWSPNLAASGTGS